jgi:RNA polymerase sigma factor (sigma-70 family)
VERVLFILLSQKTPVRQGGVFLSSAQKSRNIQIIMGRQWFNFQFINGSSLFRCPLIKSRGNNGYPDIIFHPLVDNRSKNNVGLRIGGLGTENDVIYKYIEDEVDKKLLHLALQKLSGRERKIMELRFGLNNGMEKTQKEVADLLGISQSYISRLEKRIIKRLKKEIHRME